MSERNDLAGVLALFDREQMAQVHETGIRRELFPGLVRFMDDNERVGFILHTRLTSEDVDRVIEEQIAYYERLGYDFEWKVYGHDTPPDLAERLERRGFDLDEVESVMVLDLQNMPQELQGAPQHDVRRITDAAELHEVLGIPGSGDIESDRLERVLLAEMSQDGERLKVYAAYVDGVPASRAWLRLPPGSQFAGLWGGATAEDYRHKGLYRALLAVRAQEALRGGARYLTIDAGSMSRPIVERLGFRLLTTATACNWKVRRPDDV